MSDEQQQDEMMSLPIGSKYEQCEKGLECFLIQFGQEIIQDFVERFPDVPINEQESTVRANIDHVKKQIEELNKKINLKEKLDELVDLEKEAEDSETNKWFISNDTNRSIDALVFKMKKAFCESLREKLRLSEQEIDKLKEETIFVHKNVTAMLQEADSMTRID